MVLRLAVAATLLTFLLCASPVHADPIFFTIDTCAAGDCSAFDQSGRGAIVAELDVINGSDLLITLHNALGTGAPGDNPHLTHIGFDYGTLLQGLAVESFTVLSGQVSAPSLSVNKAIHSFALDFGFVFHDDRNRQNWFQGANTNEIIQMVVGTTGQIDLSQFLLGVAKIGGAGENGRGGSITLTGYQAPHASVPEPGSLMLLGLGIVVFGVRRARTSVHRSSQD